MTTKRMTVREAVEIALDCVENWHGQYTGDGADEFDEHESAAVDCKCDMGSAYRALQRKLRRMK